MIRRATAFVASTLMSAAWAAPLTPLDSEQAGAAAYVTTTFATSYSEGTLYNRFRTRCCSPRRCSRG